MRHPDLLKALALAHSFWERCLFGDIRAEKLCFSATLFP
jgi:hypothetical protein